MSWHADVLFYFALEPDVYVFCCSLLNNEVQVSRVNKWLFCRHCFCTSRAVRKRHKLSLWHPGNIFNIYMLLLDSRIYSLSKSLLACLIFPPKYIRQGSKYPRCAVNWAVDMSWFILLVLLPHYSVFSGCVSTVIGVISLQGFYFLHSFPLDLSPRCLLLNRWVLKTWYSVEQCLQLNRLC